MRSKYIVLFCILMLITQACVLLGRFSEPSISDLNSNILFKDDFSEPSSGWDRVNRANGITDYVDGAYRIFVNTPSYDIWANPGLGFSDTIIEVEAEKVAGPEDNDFGIICRYQGPQNYYSFLISSDGYYGIVKVVDGQQELIDEHTMAYSEVIRKGEASNKLNVKCIGNRLSLSVNGSLLAEVNDTAFTSGDVGLIAGTFDIAGTDIYFDNFIVSNP